MSLDDIYEKVELLAPEAEPEMARPKTLGCLK
jgi:hypothetical protein